MPRYLRASARPQSTTASVLRSLASACLSRLVHLNNKQLAYIHPLSAPASYADAAKEARDTVRQYCPHSLLPRDVKQSNPTGGDVLEAMGSTSIGRILRVPMPP